MLIWDAGDRLTYRTTTLRPKKQIFKNKADVYSVLLIKNVYISIYVSIYIIYKNDYISVLRYISVNTRKISVSL